MYGDPGIEARNETVRATEVATAMKQNVPFLPRLKMTRHLSTIVEVKEDIEEFKGVDGFPFGRGQYRHRRFGRRVLSCGDIQVFNDWTGEHDFVFLPPLKNPERSKKCLRDNLKRTADIASRLRSPRDRTFPDFRPPSTSCRSVDPSFKAEGRIKRGHSTKREFSHDKEDIVDSWMQFFG